MQYDLPMSSVTPIASGMVGHREKTQGRHRMEQAVEHIEEGIRSGLYLPGHRLVETEVAANSGLGVGPVREALRLLAGEGLVEIRPYRGAVVKRLSAQEIVQIYQAAKGVVYMSLTLVAPALGDTANRERILAAVDQVRAVQEAPITELLRAVTQYYFVLHDIAGNHYLTVLIQRLHLGLVHREVANLHPAVDPGRVVKAYVEATEALLAGDADRAIDIKMAYFDNYIELIRKAGRSGMS